MDEMLRYLKALVALNAAALDETEERPRAEVLLDRAGLSIQEIADALGKSYPAVAKTLSRERATRKARV